MTCDKFLFINKWFSSDTSGETTTWIIHHYNFHAVQFIERFVCCWEKVDVILHHQQQYQNVHFLLDMSFNKSLYHFHITYHQFFSGSTRFLSQHKSRKWAAYINKNKNHVYRSSVLILLCIPFFNMLSYGLDSLIVTFVSLFFRIMLPILFQITVVQSLNLYL